LKQDKAPFTNLNLDSLQPTNFWQEALTTAENGSVSDAMNVIRSHPSGAREICLRKNAIESNLGSMAPPPPVPRPILSRDLADFTYPPHWDPSIPLLIHGRSGLGKTSLALSLIPTALIVKEPEALKLFNPKRNGGIVFDDCPLPSMRDRELQLALLDNTTNRTLSGKGKWKFRYSNPLIPAMIPMIICTNLYPTQCFLNVPEISRRLPQIWTPTAQGIFKEDKTAFQITLGEKIN